MTLELYLAYLVATMIVLVVPGPTIMLVVSYALARGRRSVWAAVAGVALGDLTAMSLSLAGLGAILAASAGLFTLLKWAGACYLIWLGITLWRVVPAAGAEPSRQHARSAGAMAGHAFAVTALNPKSIAFFVAFLPQFVRPQAPVLPQLLLLGGTFLVLAIINAGIYALLAGSLRETVRRPGVLRLVNRVGGSVLIGAGLLTAATRQPG